MSENVSKVKPEDIDNSPSELPDSAKTISNKDEEEDYKAKFIEVSDEAFKLKEDNAKLRV